MFWGGGVSKFSRQAVNLHQGNSILLIQPTSVWYCTFCMQNCHFIYFFIFLLFLLLICYYFIIIVILFAYECYLVSFLFFVVLWTAWRR